MFSMRSFCRNSMLIRQTDLAKLRWSVAIGLVAMVPIAESAAPHHAKRNVESAQTVAVWEENNLQGDAEIFADGVFFANDGASEIDSFRLLSDNQISSLRVGNGAVAWLCNDASAASADGSRALGLCHVFTNETLYNLNSHQFNNAASAIVVAQKTKSRLASGLTAWSNSFSGKSQEFSVGGYDYDDIVNGVGNDAISSIKVEPGFIATLCTNGIIHAKTPLGNGVPEGAQCRMFPEGSYPNLGMHNLNDLVTYISVSRVDTNPAHIGVYGPVKQWPYGAINQYLLTDGRVMFNEDAPDDGNPSSGEYAIWDPADDSLVQESTFAPGANLFCAGFVHLPNGNLFAAAAEGGGTTTTIAMEYDVASGRWTSAPRMNWGRYYPSATVTQDGSVLVTGGNDVFGNFYGRGVIAITEPEIYENGSWRSLPGADIPFSGMRGPTNDSSYWPWVQAAPNGQMFMGGPDVGMRFLDVSGAGENHEFGNRPDNTVRTYGSYVTYDTGKMLIAGGANSIASSSVIDFNSAVPTVSATDDLNYGRRQFDMTLLADGSAFVSGGNDDGAEIYSASGTLYVSEIWRPETGAWSVAADHVISRQYHSTAMLIPDGRVVTAGQCAGLPCQRNAEIYYPPYLFDDNGLPAVRPNILSVKKSWNYAESVSINNDVANITRAHLIKLGAVTHATNFEQRLVPLNIEANQAGVVTVTSPSSGNIAPPGHYMLIIVNDQGVPSVAEIVHVGGQYGQDDSVSFTAASYTADIFSDIDLADSIAAGAVTSQSSTYQGGVASRAVDGNTNGNWSGGSVTHTNFEQNAWWQMDLGNELSIDSIALFNRGDCCTERLSNVYVFVSDTNLTGRSFSDILSDNSIWRQHIAGQVGSKQNIPVKTQGRYVRVQLAGANYLSLAEVKVFGATQTVPTLTDTDGDGVVDKLDAFPNDPSETTDSDGDGVGNNADAFPNDSTETADSDGDGVGNNADAFPNDPSESNDSDNDGIGDNADPTPNGDVQLEQCAAVTNIAGQGTASQSSGYKGAQNLFPAGDAIDGDLSSFSHTQTGQSNPNWQLQFSGDKRLNQIVLHNRSNCCGSRLRDISVSVLNAAGATVFESPLLNPENSLNSPQKLTIDFVAITGAEVDGSKVVISRTSDPDFSGGNGNEDEADVLSLGEVEVLGCDIVGGNGNPSLGVSGINIAIGKSASQSSVAHGGDAARAVDGNASGEWSDSSITHTTSQANPWWQLDLNADTKVGELKLFNRTDCCSDRLANFHVFVSKTDLSGRAYADILADGSVWKHAFNGQAANVETIPVFAEGRYIRVQLAGTAPLSLAEVQVFPVEQGSSPTAPVNAGAVLYGNPNFDGASWSLVSGVYDIDSIIASPIGNDNLSSFTLDDGFQIEICNAAGLDGECRTFSGSVSSLVLEGFDDVASSLKVSAVISNGLACSTGGQSLLINGSFEQTDNPAYSSAEALINAEGLSNGSGKFVDSHPASDFPGWFTTGGIPLQQGGLSQGGTVEIGTSGFLGVNAAEGNVFVEMDGNVHNQLVSVNPGDTLGWSLAHRGRNGVDSILVSLGPVDQQTILGNFASDSRAWEELNGSYVVPQGVTQVQLSIAPEAASDGDIDSSNLLDNVKLCVLN